MRNIASRQFQLLYSFGIAALLLANVATAQPASSISQEEVVVDEDFEDGPPTDIAVSADGWAWNSPDFARMSFLVSGSGPSASDAVQDVTRKEQLIVDALKKLDASGIQAQLEDQRFTSPAQKGDALVPGGAVQVERLVGVSFTALDKVPAAIDLALKGGAQSVRDIEYLVRRPEKGRDKAIADASAQARAQAEKVAASLGVKVGKILSIGVTEEPAGKTMRLKRMQGEDEAELNDRETRWSVAVRFQLER